MRWPIDLDYHAMRTAAEIDRVSIDRMLPDEFIAAEASGAQFLPEQILGADVALTQVSGESDMLSGRHELAEPNTLTRPAGTLSLQGEGRLL